MSVGLLILVFENLTFEFECRISLKVTVTNSSEPLAQKYTIMAKVIYFNFYEAAGEPPSKLLKTKTES